MNQGIVILENMEHIIIIVYSCAETKFLRFPSKSSFCSEILFTNSKV